MKPTYKPSNLLILTACAAMLFAAIFGFAGIHLYDVGNYKDAAEALMFTVILFGYPFACVVVAALQAQEQAFREQYPDYVNQ